MFERRQPTTRFTIKTVRITWYTAVCTTIQNSIANKQKDTIFNTIAVKESPIECAATGEVPITIKRETR